MMTTWISKPPQRTIVRMLTSLRLPKAMSSSKVRANPWNSSLVFNVNRQANPQKGTDADDGLNSVELDFTANDNEELEEDDNGTETPNAQPGNTGHASAGRLQGLSAERQAEGLEMLIDHSSHA